MDLSFCCLRSIIAFRCRVYQPIAFCVLFDLSFLRSVSLDGPVASAPLVKVAFSSTVPHRKRVLRLHLLQSLQQMLRRILPIPLRVVLRPPPQIITRILQRPLCLPPQLLVRLGRIRRQIKHVTCSTLDDLVREVAANTLREGFDHVEDGGPATGAKVPSIDAGLLLTKVVEGSKVALREVEDMDVVPDCGAVVG